MENFTPVPALLGGLLIGLSAALLLWANGRVAGISGIAAPLLRPPDADHGWRAAFIIGLVAAAPIYGVVIGETFAITISSSVPVLLAGGLLVGFGAGLGSGCTSGHGICGLGRLSGRSLVSTLTFMATAVATVVIVHHLIGGIG
ncbi:MAG: YeeE/YedE thiosulfate transporter family protein [Rhodospirillaceae bacterium]